MATIAVGANNHFRPYRFCRLMYFLEGPAQTFKAGHVVVMNASNQIIKGGTDPAAATVVGVAAEAASGVTNRKIGVYVADENSEFQGNVQDTGALAQANIGLQYSIVLDGTNDIFRVDLGDTTNKRVVVTELIDQAGDVNGRVVFKWLNAARIPQAS